MYPGNERHGNLDGRRNPLFGTERRRLVALMYLYARIAMKSKAVLSIGLIVFAVFLLAQNLLTLYAYVSMAPLFDPATLPFLSTIAGFESVALVILLRLTI